MLPSFEIKPGIGCGILKLGMNRNEIIQLIGGPDEISEHIEVDNEVDITWDYSSLELSLHFFEDDDYRLSLIEVENEHSTVKSFFMPPPGNFHQNPVLFAYPELSGLLDFGLI